MPITLQAQPAPTSLSALFTASAALPDPHIPTRKAVGVGATVHWDGSTLIVAQPGLFYQYIRTTTGRLSHRPCHHCRPTRDDHDHAVPRTDAPSLRVLR